MRARANKIKAVPLDKKLNPTKIPRIIGDSCGNPAATVIPTMALMIADAKIQAQLLKGRISNVSSRH